MEYKEHPIYTNYLVYKDGRIFTKKYKKFIGFPDKNGYPTIRVRSDGYRRKVHHLVMDTWGNPPPKDMKYPTIDHIDGNINNNHIDNLQWLSRSDNLAKSHKTNPRLGENHGNSKLTSNDIIKIRKMYSTGKYSLAELGRKFGVEYQHIKRIVSYKLWKHIK